MRSVSEAPPADDADAMTPLQRQISTLRNDELRSDKSIAKATKRSVAEVRRVLRNPRVTDQAFDAARALLMASAPLAASTLLELLSHKSGYVRAQAAAAVLDRAGVIAPKEPLKRVKNVTINLQLNAVAISVRAEDRPKRPGT